MRVLGGGAIGGHVIPALVRAGYTVSALARTADKAAWSRDQGAAPVSVSLFDRADLTIAFAGHEAVINLTSAMPSISRFLFARAFENNTRVRTDHGSRVLVPVVELPPDLAGPILGRALEPYRRSRLRRALLALATPGPSLKNASGAAVPAAAEPR